MSSNDEIIDDLFGIGDSVPSQPPPQRHQPQQRMMPPQTNIQPNYSLSHHPIPKGQHTPIQTQYKQYQPVYQNTHKPIIQQSPGTMQMNAPQNYNFQQGTHHSIYYQYNKPPQPQQKPMMQMSNISMRPSPQQQQGPPLSQPLHQQQQQHQIPIMPQTKLQRAKKQKLTDSPNENDEAEDPKTLFEVVKQDDIKLHEKQLAEDTKIVGMTLTPQQIEQYSIRDREKLVGNTAVLIEKLNKIAKQMNMNVDKKVFEVIQLALHERMKDLLERLINISKLRIDTQKDSLNFSISSNPRLYISEVLKREKAERMKRELEEKDRLLSESKQGEKKERMSKTKTDQRDVMDTLSMATSGIKRKRVVNTEQKFEQPQVDTQVNPLQEFLSAKERSRRITKEDVIFLINQDPTLRCSRKINEDTIINLSLFYSSTSSLNKSLNM